MTLNTSTLRARRQHRRRYHASCARHAAHLPVARPPLDRSRFTAYVPLLGEDAPAAERVILPLPRTPEPAPRSHLRPAVRVRRRSLRALLQCALIALVPPAREQASKPAARSRTITVPPYIHPVDRVVTIRRSPTLESCPAGARHACRVDFDLPAGAGSPLVATGPVLLHHVPGAGPASPEPPVHAAGRPGRFRHAAAVPVSERVRSLGRGGRYATSRPPRPSESPI